MKKLRITLVSAAVAGTLVLAPAAFAYADEVLPTPDVTVEETTESVTETPVVEEDVTEEPVVVQTVQQRVVQTEEDWWLIPAGVTPVENAVGPEGFPQDALPTQIVPCERWAQVDTYPVGTDFGPTLEYKEDWGTAISWRFVYGGECPPPVVNTVCETITPGPVSTDLNDLWTNVDTRSKGHVEYVNDALHVYTDDNSSQAKVSEGISVSFPLKETGLLDIDVTAQPGNDYPYGPGLNLFVNFGADGTGTLVYESVYGQDLWLTNGSSAAVKANAPVNGGGNGSPWHGTIDQWLTKYPDAQVFGLAYSLGSGVHGDWNINSITANCIEYTFDKVEVPVIPEPKVEVTYSEFGGDKPTCENPEVTWTREKTTVTTPYKVIVVEGQYQVVEDTENISSVTVTDDETQTVSYEGDDCKTETPPNTPPSTPQGLAQTGYDQGTGFELLFGAFALLALGAGLFAVRRIVEKK